MLLQLEDCSDEFKVICDIMAHWYEIINTIQINCAFVSNHYGRRYLNVLLQIEPCNVMFKVNSDVKCHIGMK